MEQTKKVNRGLILALCILFSLVHRFLIVEELKPTEFWRSVSADELTSVVPSRPLSEGGRFFVNGDFVGYLSPAGVVEWYERFGGFISGSDNEVLVSDASNQKTTWLHVGGRVSWNTSSPVFVSGRWKISPDETYQSFRVLDDTGAELWSRIRSSPLTCFSQAKDLLATGDTSGLVEIYDRTGRVVSSFRPGGSRYEVIYQIALSPSGQRVLVLSGLEPKRLVVLEKGLEDYKPIQHERVEDNRRFSTELRWLDEEHFLFSDRDGKRLQVRRILSDWNILQEVEGEVVHAEILSPSSELLLAVHQRQRVNWHILTQQGLLRAYISAPSSLPWSTRFGERFFVIRDGILKVFERSRR